MIHIIDHNHMGKSEQGWLHSTFHFSFAEYYDPKNIKFGALRVVNDDLFDAGHGFAMHPHQNMEIISYVIKGALTHQDSMGHSRTLTRGHVQYMSAGTGIYHSEYNHGKTPLRFLQIWILPDQEGYEPHYGDHRYAWEDREHQWLLLASGMEGHAPIKLHQDMTISVVVLDAKERITYDIEKDRQVYVIQLEGSGELNHQLMMCQDGAEVTQEAHLELVAKQASQYILFDMLA